jgi:hypothetical protein
LLFMVCCLWFVVYGLLFIIEEIPKEQIPKGSGFGIWDLFIGIYCLLFVIEEIPKEQIPKGSGFGIWDLFIGIYCLLFVIYYWVHGFFRAISGFRVNLIYDLRPEFWGYDLRSEPPTLRSGLGFTILPTHLIPNP